MRCFSYLSLFFSRQSLAFVTAFIRATLFCFCFLLPVFAEAVDPQSPLFQTDALSSTSGALGSLAPPDLPETQGAGSLFLRLIAAFLFVLFLIYVTVYGLKWMMDRRGMFSLASPQEGTLRLLGSLYLAPRKSIHLVEIGKRVLVVAAGQSEIRLLDCLTDPQEISELKEKLPEKFKGVFQRHLRKNKQEEEELQMKDLALEGREALQERLDTLKKLQRRLRGGKKT